jgi:hypothetical protein
MHIRLPDMCKLVTIVNLRATSCALTHERVALGREPVRDADDLSAIKNFNLATLNNKQKKTSELTTGGVPLWQPPHRPGSGHAPLCGAPETPSSPRKWCASGGAAPLV